MSLYTFPFEPPEIRLSSPLLHQDNSYLDQKNFHVAISHGQFSVTLLSKGIAFARLKIFCLFAFQDTTQSTFLLTTPSQFPLLVTYYLPTSKLRDIPRSIFQILATYSLSDFILWISTSLWGLSKSEISSMISRLLIQLPTWHLHLDV